MEYTIRLKNVSARWEKSLSETNHSKLASPGMNSGVLVWKVPKFQEMITKMRIDRNHACYSPMFSTSEFGYRYLRVDFKISNCPEEVVHDN